MYLQCLLIAMILLSKYLTMLIFSFIGVLVSLIVSVTIGYFKNTLILNETLLINALILSISVCFVYLILPLIYKFGTERNSFINDFMLFSSNTSFISF